MMRNVIFFCWFTLAESFTGSLKGGVTNPLPHHKRSEFDRPGQPTVLHSRGGDEGGDSDDHDDVVTNETFLRDQLTDPKVRRKKKNGRYRAMDNRDALPFVVQVSTPDPYTSNDKMKQEARKNTKNAKMKSPSANTRKNLVGMNRVKKDGIDASIYSRTSDGSLFKVLGEFKLEKNTDCGDIIEVGDQEFEVQKARCQYKYAGGRQFVMVRKILEVKEVTRIALENDLKRQFQNSKPYDGQLPNLD